ncbi:MAG: hypothetical protein BroJett011_62090 [Chloroflexota bacterium]|nr:MAG: hypothetical protein BroJett011_62090 [Chloroflexota bacterium]
MINYDIIKQLAASQGISVTELCALAPANDPFYTGRPSEIIAAEWFTNLWRSFGYGRGVHLRRVHYQIVSQNPPIARPDGRPYENTESCWDYLNNASKWARYLGLVQASAFVDRRNPEAAINAYYWGDDPTPGYGLTGGWDEDGYELPELPELDSLPYALPDPPAFEVSGYESIPQPFHLEIWCEKTTMNDVLTPLCRRYSINLVTGAGEMSITAVVDFMRRAQEANKPARILYISDFDPAGLGMPISVARKIEFFQRNEGFEALDIRLHPIVLTADQVAHFTLPRVPVKDSDLRKANFEAAYGQGQVELDALEALYPGQLARIVTAAILHYHDPTLTQRAMEQKEALQQALASERQAVIEDHRDDLESLEDDYGVLLDDFKLVREDFAELIRDFQPRIDAYKERLAEIKQRGRAVYGTLFEALKRVDLDLDEDFPLPEPELPDEPETLYDSSRDYLTQLLAYKAQRHGTNGHAHD